MAEFGMKFYDDTPSLVVKIAGGGVFIKIHGEAKYLFDKLIKWLNDLNPRQLLILAGFVMLLMFSVIYVFLSWWTAEKDDDKNIAEEPVAIELKTVVTAKTDIPPMTEIKSEMLETKELAEELIPKDAVTDTAEVINLFAKTEIFAGDVITERKLSSNSEQVTFVGTIPADCRAVSISVNEITSVDGFAKPGDRVDLLLVETSENRSATATVLLQDVLLLSINKNMENNGGASESEGGKKTTVAVENPSTATFALRPDEILKLVAASKLGEIYLTLRPTNPAVRYSDRVGYTIDSVNADKQKQETPQPAVSQPQVTPLPPIPQTASQVEKVPDVNKFEIIQGDKIVQEK